MLWPRSMTWLMALVPVVLNATIVFSNAIVPLLVATRPPPENALFEITVLFTTTVVPSEAIPPPKAYESKKKGGHCGYPTDLLAVIVLLVSPQFPELKTAPPHPLPTYVPPPAVARLPWKKLCEISIWSKLAMAPPFPTPAHRPPPPTAEFPVKSEFRTTNTPLLLQMAPP